MKIVSEKQLEYIKNEYLDIFQEYSKQYVFERSDLLIFNNLFLFYDNNIFEKIRNDHYLSMSHSQRVWNKYFWYLRYTSNLQKQGINIETHTQPFSEILEELSNTCQNIDALAEHFVNFATNFEKQEYIIFDYFHPTITETSLSLKSVELLEIVKILDIQNFNIEEIDTLILDNVDNEKAELLTYRSKNDRETMITIDTCSFGIDQIHPVDLLVKCKFENKDIVDQLLVSWWTKFWRKMGPFVAISYYDKFDAGLFFKERKRIEK
jgi:hypothetical protein